MGSPVLGSREVWARSLPQEREKLMAKERELRGEQEALTFLDNRTTFLISCIGLAAAIWGFQQLLNSNMGALGRYLGGGAPFAGGILLLAGAALRVADAGRKRVEEAEARYRAFCEENISFNEAAQAIRRGEVTLAAMGKADGDHFLETLLQLDRTFPPNIGFLWDSILPQLVTRESSIIVRALEKGLLEREQLMSYSPKWVDSHWAEFTEATRTGLMMYVSKSEFDQIVSQNYLHLGFAFINLHKTDYHRLYEWVNPDLQVPLLNLMNDHQDQVDPKGLVLLYGQLYAQRHYALIIKALEQDDDQTRRLMAIERMPLIWQPLADKYCAAEHELSDAEKNLLKAMGRQQTLVEHLLASEDEALVALSQAIFSQAWPGSIFLTPKGLGHFLNRMNDSLLNMNFAALARLPWTAPQLAVAIDDPAILIERLMREAPDTPERNTWVYNNLVLDINPGSDGLKIPPETLASYPQLFGHYLMRLDTTGALVALATLSLSPTQRKEILEANYEKEKIRRVFLQFYLAMMPSEAEVALLLKISPPEVVVAELASFKSRLRYPFFNILLQGADEAYRNNFMRALLAGAPAEYFPYLAQLNTLATRGILIKLLVDPTRLDMAQLNKFGESYFIKLTPALRALLLHKLRTSPAQPERYQLAMQEIFKVYYTTGLSEVEVDSLKEVDPTTLVDWFPIDERDTNHEWWEPITKNICRLVTFLPTTALGGLGSAVRNRCGDYFCRYLSNKIKESNASLLPHLFPPPPILARRKSVPDKAAAPPKPPTPNLGRRSSLDLAIPRAAVGLASPSPAKAAAPRAAASGITPKRLQFGSDDAKRGGERKDDDRGIAFEL